MINTLVGLHVQACQWPSVLANCAIERGAKVRKKTEFLFPHFILGGGGGGGGRGVGWGSGGLEGSWSSKLGLQGMHLMRDFVSLKMAL
jgi:hypothetical protein